LPKVAGFACVALAGLLLAISCGGSKAETVPAGTAAIVPDSPPSASVVQDTFNPSPPAGPVEPAASTTNAAPAPDAVPAANTPSSASAAPSTPAASTPAPVTTPSPAAPQTGISTPSTAAPPAAPATQRKLGELVFTEGSVTIHRAGAAPERGDIGSIVRVYDVLVTGPKSRAEVDIASGSAGGASVKLAENTAFYFDTKELSDEGRKTVLQLLSGAVAVKVDKLANGSFSVGTDQAVLGVRGTVFIVDTVPDGSLLVTCETGAVQVNVHGSIATAKPGTAVELQEAGSPGTVAVDPANLGAYRSGWRTEAYTGFATRAVSYTSSYSAALEAGKPVFNAAFAKLDAQKTALDAWRAARAAGKVPRMTDWISEKKAVSAALFDCLKALFSIERPYYRLLELKALHTAGTGVGTLKNGTSSASYFAGFDASNSNLALGMAKVREALLLFSWVSAGSPLGDFFGSKAESLGTGSLFLED